MTAWLYESETAHRRTGAVTHGFRYRLFQILLDVDRIDEDLRGLRMIRRGRLGLFSYHDRDHGWRDDRPLRGWVLERLAEADVAATAHRIRLLAMPRVLGFVFNPISLFYVEDAAGGLEAVIYEVNSTFGQTHAYVAPASGRGFQRQTANKRLFVSPFYGVDGAYRFDVSPPGGTLDLAIVKTDAEGRPEFTATLNGRRKPLTDGRMLRLFLGFPLMTLQVVVGIHWQAFRLFVKGARLVPRPAGPDIGTSAAALDARHGRKNDVSLAATEGSADDDHRPDPRLQRSRLGHTGVA
ncbi:MAG: DUF1365 domain-containing protein [Caulobacter sp.]|nr:DUF1365 domain-containing protein [Caulobacter sp.]